MMKWLRWFWDDSLYWLLASLTFNFYDRKFPRVDLGDAGLKDEAAP
jgi:hypothetical protein